MKQKLIKKVCKRCSLRDMCTKLHPGRCEAVERLLAVKLAIEPKGFKKRSMHIVLK